jgi:uncharacterized cupredoxin-like copper-binding protein
MKNFKKSWLVMVICLVCMVFLLPIQTQAASITLNQSEVTCYVGTKTQLTVNGSGKKVTWTSSNSSIATVTSKGKVTAKKAGKVTITAKVGSKKLKCKFIIKNADATADKITFKVKTDGDFITKISTATISFLLKSESTGVKAQIVNSSNKVVYTKTFARCKANKTYSFTWNGKNTKKSYVSQGSYYVRIVAGETESSSSMMKIYSRNDFAGGDGSASNPYLVASYEQLKKVSQHNGRYFKQTADINGDYNTLTPMYTVDNPFTGQYDGGNYQISYLNFINDTNSGLFGAIGTEGVVTNLVVDHFMVESSSDSSYVGTIAGINNGTISDINVKNTDINAYFAGVGGICGQNNATVTNCTVSDSSLKRTPYSNGHGSVGGIAAENNATISDCQVSNLSLKGFCLGGIVGNMETSGSQIISCGSTGTIEADDDYSYLGAIVGYMDGTTLSGCYTDTTLNLAGRNWEGTIE